MISVIAFDYGGVIEITEKNIITEITEYLNIPKDQWLQKYFTLNHLSNVEDKTWNEVIVMTAQSFGTTEEQIKGMQEMMQANAKNKKLNTELLDIIRSLKPKYRIALISNYPARLRQKMTDQGIIDLFDEVIISGEVGFQKPQPEIFNFLCDKIGIPISGLAFVDDTENSLKDADIIGYTPILYTTNEQLKTDLDKILEVNL